MELTLQPLVAIRRAVNMSGCAAVVSVKWQQVYSNSLVWRMRNTSSSSEICGQGDKRIPSVLKK